MHGSRTACLLLHWAFFGSIIYLWTLMSVCWSVARSVIIFLKGGKLHFHCSFLAICFCYLPRTTSCQKGTTMKKCYKNNFCFNYILFGYWLAFFLCLNRLSKITSKIRSFCNSSCSLYLKMPGNFSMANFFPHALQLSHPHMLLSNLLDMEIFV